MSRLFLRASSDTCTGKTMTGQEYQSVSLYYGSKKNSMRACKILITYNRQQERPLLQIETKGKITTLEIEGELK